ncbi:hypothetical protein [Serratia nevei]|uniref:hypothetical protein n=1 Tax=Serratia nevei TaxID=2703794 RepID=UPI00369FB814
MASGLNKKQRDRLNALSHGELLTVIDDLIQDNKQAKTTLINKYLLSDDDLLKAVQKEYAKLSKSTRFYDYYAADARFDELTRIIAEPLQKTAVALPEQTESLCAKIIHGFEKLIENIDSSGGSWMTYYSVLIEAWLSAVAAQKIVRPPSLPRKLSISSTVSFILVSVCLNSTVPCWEMRYYAPCGIGIIRKKSTRKPWTSVF